MHTLRSFPLSIPFSWSTLPSEGIKGSLISSRPFPNIIFSVSPTLDCSIENSNSPNTFWYFLFSSSLYFSLQYASLILYIIFSFIYLLAVSFYKYITSTRAKMYLFSHCYILERKCLACKKNLILIEWVKRKLKYLFLSNFAIKQWAKMDSRWDKVRFNFQDV